RDDSSGVLSQSVRDFNEAPNAETARRVVDASGNLDGQLADLENEDLFADVYLGVSVSEPGDLRGAGFFMGTRLLAGGSPSVSSADRETLGAYREGLLFIASNGTQGVEHPELFDANGELIDPGNNYDSTASAAGLALTEAGVSLSRQFQFLGSPIAAGLSFKVQRVDTFEDTQRVVDNRIDTERNSENDGNINFDIGLAKNFGSHWRAGFAVKDVIAHDYVTSQGTTIRLRPRPRLGLAYQNRRLQIAADADLTSNEPLGSESATQEFALGAEWTLAPLGKLRAGYRYDFQGNRNEVLSVGAGTVWKRLAIDAAYAQGSSTRALALQFGIVF
ncbi:MAG: conjugal transfer protein TraF, partial [Woeseia sp.]